MINSRSISTEIQAQLCLPSNSYKNSPTPSRSRHVAFNFRNTGFKNALISIRKTPNLLPNAAATDGVYTASPEETFYDLLGVSQNGTLSEIKRGYKQMVLKYHPDVSPPDRVDEYTTRFIRVQEAYRTLSDPESRAVYDYNLCFSEKKGSRFSEEMAQWRQSWEVQVEELKRRSTAEMEGGRMSWAARIRRQRAVLDLDQ